MTGLNILARLKAFFLSLALGLSGPAIAGDAAYPEALGFSDDGTRFAFAEWGIQDGSGFSYANVFVIDLVKDAWIAPPVRKLVQDEAAQPRAVLNSALVEAEAVLAGAGIDQPARLVFARPYVIQQAGARHSLGWRPISMLGGRAEPHEIMVEIFPLDGVDCDDESYGLALRWDGREVYRDTRLSTSRGCPLGYSVDRVYISESLRANYAVALVGVYRWSFEGPDLRYIAVPIPLN